MVWNPLFLVLFFPYQVGRNTYLFELKTQLKIDSSRIRVNPTKWFVPYGDSNELIFLKFKFFF